MRIQFTIDPYNEADRAGAQHLLDALAAVPAPIAIASKAGSASDAAPSEGDGAGPDAEEASGAPSPDPGASAFGPEEADRTLELLYEDGSERHGSLLFLDAALKHDEGYTIAEISDALNVTPDEARAYRRNLGRALAWIKRNEIESLPEIFDYWKEGDSWRYMVIPEIREAAGRQGLI